MLICIVFSVLQIKDSFQIHHEYTINSDPPNQITLFGTSVLY